MQISPNSHTSLMQKEILFDICQNLPTLSSTRIPSVMLPNGGKTHMPLFIFQLLMMNIITVKTVLLPLMFVTHSLSHILTKSLAFESTSPLKEKVRWLSPSIPCMKTNQKIFIMDKLGGLLIKPPGTLTMTLYYLCQLLLSLTLLPLFYLSQILFHLIYKNFVYFCF